jgi:uncharacterized protein (DUF885 family)
MPVPSSAPDHTISAAAAAAAVRGATGVDRDGAAALARADALVERYVGHIRAHQPVEATRLGLRERDGDLPDLAPAALAERSRDLAVLAGEVAHAMAQLPSDADADTGLLREARDDLALLTDELEYRRFLLDVRPRFVLDPLAALETIAAGVHELLRREDLDLEERRRRTDAASRRARRIPVLLEQAGTLLASAPEPNLDVAMQRLPALIALVRDELPARAARVGADIAAARDAGEVAAEGLEAYGALLDELSEEPAAPWRLGPSEHAVTLRAALGTRMAPVQIEDRARTWIESMTAEMAELAASTWTRRFPGERRPSDRSELIRRTLEAVAATAVPRGTLVEEARRAVEEARAFALEVGLTDVPPAARLTMAEVPPYLRGIAVAFITQAPPLDADAGCTYYVSPVPTSWNEHQAASFLREYNPAQLRSLAIHEGYPGHFVQLEHASQHPRLARRLLTRPVFAEGWAVHIEREILAAGFGDDGSSAVDGDDYRITQRKLELRVATNALLDVGLHAGDLADDDAVRLLTCTAFQEATEARGKLVRAKVTSGQLCAYFVGGEELADLHSEVRARERTAFDARSFHQRLLSHGTPTTAIVARALRDDAPARRPFAAA